MLWLLQGFTFVYAEAIWNLSQNSKQCHMLYIKNNNKSRFSDQWLEAFLMSEGGIMFCRCPGYQLANCCPGHRKEGEKHTETVLSDRDVTQKQTHYPVWHQLFLIHANRDIFSISCISPLSLSLLSEDNYCYKDCKRLHFWQIISRKIRFFKSGFRRESKKYAYCTKVNHIFCL